MTLVWLNREISRNETQGLTTLRQTRKQWDGLGWYFSGLTPVLWCIQSIHMLSYCRNFLVFRLEYISLLGPLCMKKWCRLKQETIKWKSCRDWNWIQTFREKWSKLKQWKFVLDDKYWTWKNGLTLLYLLWSGLGQPPSPSPLSLCLSVCVCVSLFPTHTCTYILSLSLTFLSTNFSHCPLLLFRWLLSKESKCKRVKQGTEPYQTHISRVLDQNGVSLLYIMLEIHHAGQEPSICGRIRKGGVVKIGLDMVQVMIRCRIG